MPSTTGQRAPSTVLTPSRASPPRAHSSTLGPSQRRPISASLERQTPLFLGCLPQAWEGWGKGWEGGLKGCVGTSLAFSPPGPLRTSGSLAPSRCLVDGWQWKGAQVSGGGRSLPVPHHSLPAVEPVVPVSVGFSQAPSPCP